MVFNENQIVKIRWNTSNRKHFESNGYVFTKYNDFFDVVVKDLNRYSTVNINAICDYCGKEYQTSFASIMNGRVKIQKDCCVDCIKRKQNEIYGIKRAEKYIGMAKEICIEKGYTLITTVDDYTDLHMKIRFICPKHGEQSTVLQSFLKYRICKGCSYENRMTNLRNDIVYIKEKIESVNNNKLLNPNDYHSVFDKNLNILCSCGNVFTTSFRNYDKHNVNRCQSCSNRESKGENRIRHYLEDNEIYFIQEKRFDDCRDINTLPFDFYIPNKSLIIEFDGEQHFWETGYGSYESTKNMMKSRINIAKNIILIY